MSCAPKHPCLEINIDYGDYNVTLAEYTHMFLQERQFLESAYIFFGYIYEEPETNYLNRLKYLLSGTHEFRAYDLKESLSFSNLLTNEDVLMISNPKIIIENETKLIFEISYQYYRYHKKVHDMIEMGLEVFHEDVPYIDGDRYTVRYQVKINKENITTFCYDEIVVIHHKIR